jgi:hypothetical protein
VSDSTLIFASKGAIFKSRLSPLATYFLCRRKKSKQKSGFPRSQLTRRADDYGIFRLAIHGSVGKRCPSMGSALRVCVTTLLLSVV